MSPDDVVQKVSRIWAPRFTANGVDPNDFAATTSAIETWGGWLDGWTALADRYEKLAVEAEARGRWRSAGEFYRHASIAQHFGEFVWFEDLHRHNEAAVRSAGLMRRSLALLDPSAERLEIAFDGARLVANLRKPAGVPRPAAVILIPGLDSSKEEFCNFEQCFLDRGLATVAFDGPGQGETLQWLPLLGDYERPVAALIDVLERRDDLAPGAVGALGMSLGGYFVARAAAGEPRIRALVALSGPLSVAGWLAAGISDISKNALMVKVGARDEDDLRRLTASFDLEPVIGRMTQPALLVTGRLDRVIPWEQTELQAKRAPNAELVIYEEGTHVLNNMPAVVRPMLADWMSERLAQCC
jgi:pimeloyl-ACP methyl ester carboxylesterase